ncbi:MAG: B12-binding domain-containing radical SAM protein [Alphaproteobacteria bacterium]|nr:B12-binding domain-containing radical SAM protein [Alphaproteobacteria bacterium]
MRLLLINPKVPESFWSFKWAVAILPGKRAVNPPLGLATVAALCPPDWQVEIVDENIEAVPPHPHADLIGIGGMGVQAPRQRELLAYFRERGYRTVIGGAAASLMPEKYEGLADTVVAGEAEYVWPRFCRDAEAGAAEPLYRETGEVDLKDSPVPRFDLLKLGAYANATLQYSRGCPYTCEFCDIIVMFGRKPRLKAPAQIGRELDVLRGLGVRSVFFVDDNFIGNKKETKRLLHFLQSYQGACGNHFSFGTEVSINLSQDEELLALFGAANFNWVFIGIESPDPESLKETGKSQNLREDLLTSVRRLHAHGIDVLAGFIVGFDHDTPSTFEAQYKFIMESGIQTAMMGLLSAVPRTPLYERLRREGRVRDGVDESDNTRARSNVIHKTMSEDVISRLYTDVYRRLLSDSGISTRIRNKLRYLGARHYSGGYSLGQSLALVGRLLRKGILPGGPRRLWLFLRSFPWRRPSLAPTVLADWIAGLSMRRFAADHLWSVADLRLLEAVEARIRRILRQGQVWVNAAAVPQLNIRLGEELSRRSIRRAGRQLRRLMKGSRARLMLRVDALPAKYLRAFEHQLKRLARHGDRVYVELSDGLRERLTIDLSAFNLVLVA